MCTSVGLGLSSSQTAIPGPTHEQPEKCTQYVHTMTLDGLRMLQLGDRCHAKSINMTQNRYAVSTFCCFGAGQSYCASCSVLKQVQLKSKLRNPTHTRVHGSNRNSWRARWGGERRHDLHSSNGMGRLCCCCCLDT